MLLGLSAGTLEALQHAHQQVQSGSAELTYLNAADASEIEALAATILPSDETPGAKEAGVIFFIDRALASFDRDKRNAYRTGMETIQQKRKELFVGSASLASLSAGQREALLKAVEKTEFFELLRTHVVTGFLAIPAWGGNRDHIGWKLIGFEDSDAFQPPFGYYDQPENRK